MIKQDNASFRDPAGHVFVGSTAVYRTVMPIAAQAYEAVRAEGALQTWIDKGWLWPEESVALTELPEHAGQAYALLKHPRLPFISYPYEWPFAMLQAAAVFHLDMQIRALDANIMLNDASAYNIQFVGSKPVFIDHLAFRPYEEGEFWQAHRQFCQQFLNPLLLQAYCKVPYHTWYRGNMHGINTTDLAKVLPWRRKYNWRVLSHVTLQAHFDKNQRQTVSKATRKARMPKSGLRQLWVGLRDWIANLQDGMTQTTWQAYAHDNSYEAAQTATKQAFVSEFVTAAKPGLLWDLGCNAGIFSKAALNAGAERVIGFDFDHGALHAAYQMAEKEQLNLQPLFLDATNPSPSQGWAGIERQSFAAREPADAIFALALIHHIAISANVPLPLIVKWLFSLAPAGVVEFVPKADPMVQLMLSQRADIFTDYTLENFIALLEQQATIVKRITLVPGCRELIWYERSAAWKP